MAVGQQLISTGPASWALHRPSRLPAHLPDAVQGDLRELANELRKLLLDWEAGNHLMCVIYFAVGKMGQHSLVACSGDLNKAKEIFQKK